MKFCSPLRVLVLLALLLLSGAPTAHAQSVESFSGKCISVSDGDTIGVRVGGKTEKVRLLGIDSPEKNQPFGMASKNFLSDLAFGKIVRVEAKERDRYGRVLGWVYVGNLNLNHESLKNGMSWWYKDYSPKETQLAEFEQSARARRLGLWSEQSAIAPWQFRRDEKATRAAKKRATPRPSSTSRARRTPQSAPPQTPKQEESPLWIALGIAAAVIGFLLKARRRRR